MGHRLMLLTTLKGGVRKGEENVPDSPPHHHLLMEGGGGGGDALVEPVR